MRALLTVLPEKRAALKSATAPSYALAEVRLEAPIADPQKFLAIGMNYKAHAEEAAAGGVPVPTSQLWFNKQVSCITGPYSPVQIRKAGPDKVDYEAELGVVIGRRCRHVSREEAPGVIAGYFVANDVTARDWQFRSRPSRSESPSIRMGRSVPGSPWPMRLPIPHALELTLLLNGEPRQKLDRRHDLRHL